MRLFGSFAGLLLVSSGLYAQHSPVAASTPAPATHTTTSSPSTSTSSSPASSSTSSASSSSGIHSSPSSSPSSSPTASGSSSSHSGSVFGGGSSAGSNHDRNSAGSESNSINRRDRDKDTPRGSTDSIGSHGSGSTGREAGSANRQGKDSSSPVRDSKNDTPEPRRHDSGLDKTTATEDTQTVNHREKDRGSDKASDSATASRTQVAKAAEEPADAKRNCDKPPCAKPTPEPSHADWRQGRCKDGPCEPCPPGTVAGRYGACVANPAYCTAGTVWNGAGCVPAAAAVNAASASQCISFYSRGVNISTDLALAKAKVNDACRASQASTECTFAEMHLSAVKQSCEMLRTEAFPHCQTSVPSCL